ncbi:hypothetical protein EX895_001339 [Sporisorium graminicola]|uniref:Uncharacterized protein n=1 Tax=Sporisorium graminicola TaxID=280036 RepID=A0A4U7KXK5_9BASI|nr:hypothetical protein EX895_001339 [Sporisorium graminicola]TKY89554.1 hypothetical protein EX895_001339 [Sporisorium graminicola]
MTPAPSVLAALASACVKTDPSTLSNTSAPNQAGVIVLSDDEDEDEELLPNPVPISAPTANTAAAVEGANEGNDDDSDDGIEFLGSSGPLSAILNAQPRNVSAQALSRVATRVTSSNRITLGKRRATDEGTADGGWGKMVKSLPAQFYTSSVRGAGTSSDAAASTKAKEGVKTEPLAPSVPIAAASTEGRISEWTVTATAAVEPWRPPTPPHSTSSGSSSSMPNRFECNLGDHARRALGAKEYRKQNIWVDPDFSLDNLPFSIEEVPSFERGSWLGLGTHRYVVVSDIYPRTQEAERERAREVKAKLLGMFKQREWGEGEEPEVSFPYIQRIDHDFVDVKLFTHHHHLLARTPAHHLHFERQPFIAFLHGAFVDASQWLILQFTHPTIAKHQNEPLSLDEQADLLAFGKTALIAVAHHPRLKRIATPLSLWLLPTGYPHNDQLAAAHNWTSTPEYTLLLKRIPCSPDVHLPSHIEVRDPGQRAKGGAHGYKRWIKLWWDGRHIDLCNYCKNADDGHTNAQCPNERRCDTGKPRAVKYRPAVY